MSLISPQNAVMPPNPEGLEGITRLATVNSYLQSTESPHVPLFNRRGEVVAHAIVDAQDIPLVADQRWHRDKGYALSGPIAMHRLILGMTKHDGREVDHINRNKLDNRRANLRIVDRATNARNRGPKRGTRYCGVHFDSCKGRWRASFRYKKEYHHVGWFGSEEEAGRAADAWSRKHFPERWLTP